MTRHREDKRYTEVPLQVQDEVRSAWHNEWLALVTRLGERCTTVPMRVQDGDKAK